MIRFTLTFFLLSPPPTENIRIPSLLDNLLVSSHPEKTVSQPSSLVLAVSSETLSVGATINSIRFAEIVILVLDSTSIIEKQGEIVKLEAQINYLDEIIEEKSSRLNSINEDDNLKELVDRKKMKVMQKEVKLLEKRKAKMEKMYEKMSGKKYKEVVDEINDQSVFDFANPTGGETLDPQPKKVGKGTGKSYLNRPSGPAKHP